MRNNAKPSTNKSTAYLMKPASLPSPMNTTNWWLPLVQTEQTHTQALTWLATLKTSQATKLKTGQKYRLTALKTMSSADSTPSWRLYMKRKTCHSHATAAKWAKPCWQPSSHTILMVHKPFWEHKNTWRTLQSPTSKTTIEHGTCPTIWPSVCQVTLISTRR